MSGDGISLQTTIAQSGTVAKTQLKGQQQHQQTVPLSEQLDKSKDLKVNRVKQAEKAEQNQVDPDARREKGQRRKERKRRAVSESRVAVDVSAKREQTEETTASQTPEAAGEVGSLVDKRA